MNLTPLRKQCKKLMIDLDLDRPGSVTILAKELSANRNVLNMALTGYRNTKRSKELLEKLFNYLSVRLLRT